MQVINLPTGTGDTVKLSGEIDCHLSRRFRAVMQVKLREQHPLLVLDCSEVEYVDSGGMAALIEYQRNAEEFGGRMAIIGLNPSLKSIFHLVHLDERLLLFETVEAAKSAIFAEQNHLKSRQRQLAN